MKIDLKFFLFLFLTPSFAFSKIDSSSLIFIPESWASQFQAYQETPITAWNFMVYDSEKSSKEAACEVLSKWPKDVVFFNPCQHWPINDQWMKDWALEQTLSHPPPKSQKEFEEALNKAMVRLSLPVERNALDLMREYPLASLQTPMKNFEDFFSENENPRRWKAVPFILNIPTNDQQAIANLIHASPQLKSAKDSLFWLGPHRGTFENKNMIIEDLGRVAFFGGCLILALTLFLFLSGRRLFFLIIPVTGISVAISFVVTHLVWNSVHGLTLAFGSGLVGISMDYAFHGWQQKHDPLIWKSNAISFLTTFMSFLCLSFFTTPLIQQISLFAMVGIGVAFALSFLISVKMPVKYRRSFTLTPPRLKPQWAFPLATAFVGLALVSIFFVNIEFDMKQFDGTTQLLPSLFNPSDLHQNKDQLAFVWTQKGNREDLQKVWSWGKYKALLSPLSLQQNGSDFNTNRQLWENLVCDPRSYFFKTLESKAFAKLFQPIREALNCEKIKSLYSQRNLASFSLFSSEKSWLSLVRIDSELDKKDLQSSFTDVFFLSQLSKDFPDKLQKETNRFLVLVFLVSLSLLTVFFRNKAPMALLPAIGGLSGMIITYAISGLSVSFISFTSAILLLGLTTDYGVFCTSYILWKKPLKSAFGPIALSAMTSIAGFSPLVLCNHPVLRDMGITLTSGLFGALLLCFLCYPNLIDSKKGKQT